MDWTHELAIQSCDTGQRIPYLDSRQLIITLKDVQYQVKHNLYTPSFYARKYDISHTLTERADVRTDDFSRGKISWMHR